MAISKLKETCKNTQQEAFDYFEQLLSREHVPKWHEIVKEQCDTVPYVDLYGKRQDTVPQGRVFDALESCYIQVMLTIAPQDAAERHRRYWKMTIQMCEDFNNVILIDRMRWANEISIYLPCMKHVKDSPVL